MDHIVDMLIEKRVYPMSASENSEPLIALRTLQLAAPPETWDGNQMLINKMSTRFLRNQKDQEACQIRLKNPVRHKAASDLTISSSFQEPMPSATSASFPRDHLHPLDQTGSSALPVRRPEQDFAAHGQLANSATGISTLLNFRNRNHRNH